MIFALFKIAEIRKVELMGIIIINYLTASTLGLFLHEGELTYASTFNSNWFFLTIIIGVMFIGMFFLIGYSSQKAGISPTTVSTKMSVVIPIVFSILYDPTDTLSIGKTLGIGLALVALFLSVYKKRGKKMEVRLIYLPVILFVGMGLIDSFVKYAQQDYIDDANLSIFTALTFAGSFFTGLVVILVLQYPVKKFFDSTTWVIGILLGATNFGSMYFLVMALETSMISGSAIFGINNIGIVGLSVLTALAFFKEKLKPINWIGIFISMIAIWVLAVA